MKLNEIFDEKQTSNLKTKLQQYAIDYLTPLIANKVPFVTIQQVIDDLRHLHPGMYIDRGFVMDILDPIDAVQSIEGDRIILHKDEIEGKEDKNDAEKEVDKIKKMATDQAKKEVKDKKIHKKS